jgi:hypothetical protein
MQSRCKAPLMRVVPPRSADTAASIFCRALFSARPPSVRAGTDDTSSVMPSPRSTCLTSCVSSSPSAAMRAMPSASTISAAAWVAMKATCNTMRSTLGLSRPYTGQPWACSRSTPNWQAVSATAANRMGRQSR